MASEVQVDNGVNVAALLVSPGGADGRAGGRKFQVAGDVQLEERDAQPFDRRGLFRPWRRAEAQTTFTFDADHPEVFASEDNGATPVELVLVGLASCLTAGVAAVAQNRGIQLRSVTATLEGGMNIQGILGIDKDVRNGFDGIKVDFKIDADASEDDIKALVAQSQKRSAVFDIVTNPTNVTVSVNS